MSEESVSSSGSEEESSYEDDEEDEQTDSTAPTTSPQISPVDTGAAIITPITTTPTPTPTPDPNLANSLTPTTPATPDSGVPLANTVNPTNTVNHETVSVLPGIVNGVDSVVSGSAVSGVPDVSGTQPVVNSFEPPTASFSVSRSTAVPPCAFPTPNYLPNEAASCYYEIPNNSPSAAQTNSNTATDTTLSESLPSSVQCPNCHRLAVDPIVLDSCGHTLCYKCFSACNVCPLDNKLFCNHIPNLQLQTLIENVTIRCRYGCGATFPTSNEKAHFSVCSHAQCNWWRLLQAEVNIASTQGVETYLDNKIPRGEKCIAFDVYAEIDFRVILNNIATPSRGTDKKVYNFVLGKYNNKSTQLEFRNSGGKVVCSNTSQHALLSLGSWQSFWISFDSGYIVLGRGRDVGKNILLAAHDPDFVECDRIGFSYYSSNDRLQVKFKDVRCTNSPTWHHKCIRAVLPYTKKNKNPWSISLSESSLCSILYSCESYLDGASREVLPGFVYPSSAHDHYILSNCECIFFVMGISQTAEFTMTKGSLVPSIVVSHNGVNTLVQPVEEKKFTIFLSRGAPDTPCNDSASPILVATHFHKGGISLVVDHHLNQRAAGIYLTPQFMNPKMEVRSALNFMVATWNILTDLGIPAFLQQHQLLCKIKNFSTNNPLLVFQEPHWQFSMIKVQQHKVAPVHESYVCRFFLDKRTGGITKNVVNASTLVMAGQPCALFDFILFVVRTDGGLDIRILCQGQQHNYSIIPDLSNFSSVRVVSQGAERVRVICNDDAQKGMFTSVVQPLLVPTALPIVKVYHYDNVTGVLKL